ncbi:MAG: DUF2975 domain-containing protein [Stackebrandtia sp.]
MVRRRTVLSDAALRQPNVAFGALVTFAALLVPFTVFHLVADTLATPMYYVVAVIGVGVVAAALGVRVARRLLTQAIARDAEAARMRAELDEVI